MLSLALLKNKVASPPPFKQMDEFRAALDACNLADLGYVGYPYTWNNKRLEMDDTKERLDKAVADTGWRNKFQGSVVTHLFSHASDHRPIILHVRTTLRCRGKSTRSFRFEEAWLIRDDCEHVIQEAWSYSGDNVEPRLRKIREKIRTCGSELQAWGTSHTHPNEAEIKKVQKRVEDLSMADHTVENKAEILATSRTLDELLLKQEIYWKQRARVAWLKHGDRNTKYFHSKASQRRRRNFILGIRDQNNGWVDVRKEVTGVAIKYFKSIFSSRTCQRLEECLNAVQQKVTTDMRDILSRDYSVEEVQVALFQKGPTKAPRPDGMNALFYQKYWHIVGNDVTAAVLDFLNYSTMFPNINYTHIVLIPKVKSPKKNV